MCELNAWQKRFLEKAEATGYYFEHYMECFDDDICDDDGFLHIRKNHIRISFDIDASQNMSKEFYNRVRTRILKAMVETPKELKIKQLTKELFDIINDYKEEEGILSFTDRLEKFIIKNARL